MKEWTKKAASRELHELISKIDTLSNQRRFSTDHTRWIARTRFFLEEVFGQNSMYFRTFVSYTWNRQGSFAVLNSLDPEPQIEETHQVAYRHQLDSAKGLLLAAKDHLGRADIDSVYEGKDTGPESSEIVKIINLAEFKLRKVIRNSPKSEKEVQDAFENLLVGADVPYSRESVSIEYSSKTYRPDFTIDKIDLAVEIKFCNTDDREKPMIAEINDDILAYQTKYGNLLFVVYDTGHIRDVDRFKDEFEKNQKVIVKVVKQ